MAAVQTRQQQRERPTSPAAARTAVGRGLRGRGGAAAAAAEGEEPDVEAGRRGLPVLLRCAQNQGRMEGFQKSAGDVLSDKNRLVRGLQIQGCI